VYAQNVIFWKIFRENRKEKVNFLLSKASQRKLEKTKHLHEALHRSSYGWHFSSASTSAGAQ
jgi:hypothetical protein